MNIFSKQRYLGTYRFGMGSVFVLLTLLVTASMALAQSGDDLFRGTWQIDTPDDGALILIVKRNGLASYFWGDNTDRTVYQGTWTSTDEAATLSWPDGTQHRIVRDALGFGISLLDANQSNRYTVPAQQVPQEILGQWAKPPGKENEVVSARDQAKGFFGVWQVGQGSDGHFIFVEANRSAASSWGDDARGLRGSWAKQGSELHIVWDNGQYSILRENERAFSYKQIESGVIIEDDETELVPASRTVEANVPSAWLSNYTAEREIRTGGIAFSSRKNARIFYRGAWLVRLGEKSFERIEIGRFGGLTTSTDRRLEGSWRMEGQDIFMRWDNGSRRILSPIGDGFVIYEFKPGRPLDGVPTRVHPTAPEDTSKLTEHLQGRADVARQMLALAEAAGINPAAQDADWGRTFARWAWPFGEDEGGNSTNALLEQGYAEDADMNPWWWPFWSESLEGTEEAPQAVEPTIEIPETEATTTDPANSESIAEPGQDAAPKIILEEATATPLAPTPTAATESEAPAAEPKASKADRKEPTKKDWEWPF
jgi:hypothetical protein